MSYQIKDEGTGRPYEYPTMLAGLRDQRIICVDASGDRFVLTENCDGYYSVGVTADQLRALGEELIAMANKATRPTNG